MLCCANCFGDRGLSHIFPTKASAVGNCNYCLARDVHVAKVEDLADLLTAVLNIYDEDPAGRDIVGQLMDDWGLFQSSGMTPAQASCLIRDIIGDPNIATKKYSPSPRFRSDRLVRWGELRNELMFRNRYFPDAAIDTDRLEELFDLLRAEDMPSEWYRARIQPGDEAFDVEQMGAPPAALASHGRANPAGIPYLYIGSTPRTSVAEVRPHTGEIASVLRFTIDPASLKLVDLRSPKERVSPFTLGDEDEIGALRSDVAFLERLGQELTRPVRPSGAAIEYVPSQYLCEFIKKAGWDGVVYHSSVSDGINLALFEPARATPQEVSQWIVSRVHPEIAQLVALASAPITRWPRLARLVAFLGLR